MLFRSSDSDEEGTASRRVRLRTVLTSDLHLATPGCDAAPLLDLLRRIRHQTLFLVGDIIHTWQFKRQWYGPQAHNGVAQKLWRRARKGTQGYAGVRKATQGYATARAWFSCRATTTNLRANTWALNLAGWTWWEGASTKPPTLACCG